MIPVYLHDVVVNEDQETYLVLLKTDLQLEGSLPISVGPLSALNLADKIEDEDEDRYDTQNLIPELLENTDVEIQRIKIVRDEHGYYRAKITENPSAAEAKNTYEAELTEALAVAAETSAQLEVPPELLQNKELHSDETEANQQCLETISQLRYELEEALREENYERADELETALNNEVRKLEQSMDLDKNVEKELQQAYDNST